MNYRNEIVMYLVHDCSLNYKQIYNIEHSELLTCLEDCPELYEVVNNNVDILKSNKTGKNIAVRTIQDIIASYDRQIKAGLYTTITGITDNDYFCGYTKMEGLTLDEEFELRLKDPNLLSFLRGCGYNNKEMTLNQIRRNMNGFDRNKPAQFYIHKVYCYELNLEFVKYGITNNEPQKRIKSQMYNSNRDSDYKFESEVLYESEKLDGYFIFDVEFNIKTELAKCTKIPKSLFSDGHKETVTTEDYDALESLLDKYLQLKITL